ncbi:substrate-binding domain-containing protein [Trebonia sp.]|uniref:substrate-binding domain-containing protein n=1 Tax=Trebonia sp. TaxID=2767075 RepID=UPI00260D51A4|nr:substrate-binding domain-containing protein [Trebonia sp.]
MRHKTVRLTLGLGGALLLAAATACSSSSSTTTAPSSSSSPTASASSASALTGSCGTIPDIAYNDQSGLVASLGSYAANYDGFDGTIYKSPWSTWKGLTGKIKVGILIDGLSNGFQPVLESSLESDLQAYGYSTIALVPSSASVTDQLQGYQTLLNDGVNMIIAQAQSPTAYNSLIDKAAKEGIPTIGVLNEIADANAVNVVPNSVLGGMKLAQFVVQQAKGKGLVLFLHGIPGVPIDTDTANGANDVLKLCPQITTNESIVTQFEASIAKQQVLSYLNTHPQPVAGVITAGPFTSGVIEAFEQAGRTVPVITNNGLDDGGLAYWLQHESTFDGVALANTPNGLAYAASVVAHKMLIGDGVKINTLAIDPPLATSADLTQYVDVSSSWTINSAGTAIGPPSAYVSGAYIDSIFTK